MSVTLVLTEKYYDVGFIKRLASQREDSDVFPEHSALAKKMLKPPSPLSRGKCQVKVKYEQKQYALGGNRTASIGRFFALAYPCYQNMLGSLSRTVAKGQLAETDLANAHINIALGRWPDLAALADYCDHRADRLAELAESSGVRRWQAKELPIRIMYGGSVRSWAEDHGARPGSCNNGFLVAFIEDVREAKRRFKGLPEAEIYIKAAEVKRNKKVLANALRSSFRKEWTPDGDVIDSAFSLWLQHIEATIMKCAIDYLQPQGVVLQSLRHDSVLHSKSDEINTDALSAHASEKTGERCIFVTKLFEPDEEDLEWQGSVERGYDDPEAARREALAARDPMTTRIVECATRGTHDDVAKLFHEKHPGRFAYLGKTSGWYSFEAPLWRHIQHDTEEISHLKRELAAFVEHHLGRLEEEDAPSETEMKSVRKLVDNLGNSHFEDCLVKVLRSFYKVSNGAQWLENLDADDNIIGFDDLLYDFRVKKFREGRPEDMVSLSVGHNSADLASGIDYDDASFPPELKARMQRIDKALRACHRSDEDHQYVIRAYATSVHGKRTNDEFFIFYGVGRNGKGLAKVLLGKAFGEYFYEPDVMTTFALAKNAVKSSTGLAPALALLRGKRIAVTSEADSDAKLCTKTLKQASGRDKIQCRKLHCDPVEITVKANIFLMFNDVPGFDDTSRALPERIRAVHFPFQFVDEPVGGTNQKQIDRSLADDFATKEYGAAFLRMLIDEFNKTGHRFDRPASVVETSREYCESNHPSRWVMPLLSKYCVKGDGYKAPLKDVWLALKSDVEFFAESGSLKETRGLSKALRDCGVTVALSNPGKISYVFGYKMNECGVVDEYMGPVPMCS